MQFFGYEHPGLFIIKGNIIDVERATEPSDIIWENCGQSSASVFLKRVFSIFMCILILLACFGILLLLNYESINYVLSTFIIFAINVILT